MDILVNALSYIWSLTYVRYIVAHVLVNFVVGVSAAIHVNEFDWARLGDFFYRKILPYMLVFAVAEAFGEASGMEWLSIAAFGLIQINLLADLTGSLKKLGIPMPEFALNQRDRGDAGPRGDY